MDVIVGGGLSAHVSKLSMSTGAEFETQVAPGWWYGVVLSGEVATEQPGFGHSAWSPDTFLHYWSEGTLDTMHRVLKNAPVAAVFIHMEPDAAELLLGDDIDLVASETVRKSQLYRSGPTTRAMGQIARQMLTTQRCGTDRRLYLAGRAHDLIGSVLALEQQRADRSSTESMALTQREFGRIADAVDIVMAQLSEPPSCGELAALVGLSPKKLARGFKAAHGLTLGAYIKEQRLALARRMLEEGAPSVSSVAYELGYHPAHLATEFKRRFGFSPSALIAR